MIQTIILVLIALINLITNTHIASHVFDLARLPSTHYYIGESYLFEDGSFIATINRESYSGCIPGALCSD